jgi:hypothetical protein
MDQGMRRVLVGFVCAALGLGAFLLTRKAYIAAAVAFGGFALADRFGLVPEAFSPPQRTLFTDERRAPRIPR